jgi:hypothetical protein
MSVARIYKIVLCILIVLLTVATVFFCVMLPSWQKANIYYVNCNASYCNMEQILFAVLTSKEKTTSLYYYYKNDLRTSLLFISPFSAKRFDIKAGELASKGTSGNLSEREFDYVSCYKLELKKEIWSIVDTSYPLLKIEAIKGQDNYTPVQYKETGFTVKFYGVPKGILPLRQQYDKMLFADEGLSYSEYKQYLKKQQSQKPEGK